jgi:GMP synthase-like glutamine amidotransferase
MPKCLIIQHVAPERACTIGEALASSGVDLDTRAVHEGEDLPDDLSGFDGLVVMGGPMSALSDKGFPTRPAELELLVEALDRGVPTMGVCLGSQLLASAAGGSVSRGAAGQEIGWGPVEFSAAAHADPLFEGVPDSVPVLHWHGDTFELPPGATHIASSRQYPNQAFRVGECAWGLQFHVEVDPEAVADFVEAFGSEAQAAGVDPAAILAGARDQLATLDPVRRRLTRRFAELVGQSELGRQLVEPA